MKASIVPNGIGCMATMSIKAIFCDLWYIIFTELSGIYSKPHWDSIVENVEKMIGCGDPSNGTRRGDILYSSCQEKNEKYCKYC